MDKGQAKQRRGVILDASEEFIYCYGNRYILATAAWYVVDMKSLRKINHEEIFSIYRNYIFKSLE